jgi:DNA-binding transcriptional regulator GbsR (MarR family)
VAVVNYDQRRVGMQNVCVKRRPMNGAEIAEVLKISRMGVSQTLKRAIKKIFLTLKKSNKHLDPFDVAVMMSELLFVSLDSESEVNKFFNLFPANIKEEIERHGRTRIRGYGNKAVC